MKTFDLFDAKIDLSRLVESIESGAEVEVIIARNGKPVARLVPIAAAKPDGKRRLGIWDGRYPVMTQEEFDATNGEVLKLFYGEDGAKDLTDKT